MKNKVLYTEVIKAAENLAVALRNFADEPMYLNLCIFSRDKTCLCDGDPDGLPDFYSVVVHSAEDFDEAVPTISESSRIFYSEDKFGETIRHVLPFYRKVEDDDLQS